jgi:hypothetical protein
MTNLNKIAAIKSVLKVFYDIDERIGEPEAAVFNLLIFWGVT